MKKTPSKQYLCDILLLDVETGELQWKRREQRHFPNLCPRRSKIAAVQFNTRFAGVVASGKGTRQTVVVRINGSAYYSHRIIWKMIHGRDAVQIDHINGNRRDNRPCNLRSVKNVENCRNKPLSKANTSGAVGVSWHKRMGKWSAKIRVSYRHIHLGYFDLLNDAAVARKEAEYLYGFHSNHGRIRYQ